MKKVYISGPITGVKGYMKDFKKAAEELRVLGMESVNPAELLEDYAKTHSYRETMRECIELLAECDGIYMISGWEHSKGAFEEWEYAKAHDIVITYQGTLPRMPPEEVRRDVVMESILTFAGYFTERYSKGSYKSAHDAYRAASTIYTLGVERKILNEEDGKAIFGRTDGEVYEPGHFNGDKVRKCQEYIRKEQAEQNKIAAQRIAERMMS